MKYEPQPRRSQSLLLHLCLPPGQSSISRRPSPFSSTAYKMLLPQLLCFDNDPFSWGVYTPHFYFLRRPLDSISSIFHSRAARKRTKCALLRTNSLVCHTCAKTGG